MSPEYFKQLIFNVVFVGGGGGGGGGGGEGGCTT